MTPSTAKVEKVGASSDARSVLRNTVASIGGQMANLIVGLVSSVYVARVLGKDQFGIYQWALAICTIATAVANAGLDNVIVREVAKDRPKAPQYLLSAFGVKIFSATLCYLGVLVYLSLRGYTGIQLAVGYILCATVITESFNLSCRAALTGLERQDVTATISVITNIVRVALVIGLVHQGFNIVSVAWVTIGITLITLAAHIFFIRGITASSVWKLSLSTTKHILIVGSTFLASDIFMKLFDKADYIMLDIYGSVSDVGIYGAAYRIIDIVTMMSYSFGLAVFPIISKRTTGTGHSYANAVQKSTKYLAIFGVPLCVGLFLLSHKLMVGLYSTKYAAAGTCLSLLIWSRVGAFLFSPGLQSVAARNAQLRLVLPVILRATINIGLNFYFIPRYGYIGASISMIITENVYYSICYLYAFTGPERFNPVTLLGRPVIASLVMAVGIIIVLKMNLGILVATPIAILIYAVVIWNIGALDNEDKRLLRGLMPGFLANRSNN